MIDLTQPVTIDPKNPEHQWILELLTFTTGPLGERLRRIGYDIPRQIEAEQRCVLLWCFNLEKEFGAQWKVEGEKLLSALQPPEAA